MLSVKHIVETIFLKVYTRYVMNQGKCFALCEFNVKCLV